MPENPISKQKKGLQHGPSTKFYYQLSLLYPRPPPPAGAPDHCVCVAALLYTSKYWREFLFNMDDLNNVDFVDV